MLGRQSRIGTALGMRSSIGRGATPQGRGTIQPCANNWTGAARRAHKSNRRIEGSQRRVLIGDVDAGRACTLFGRSVSKVLSLSYQLEPTVSQSVSQLARSRLARNR